MKFAIAELRFAVLMKTKTIKKETVIALFNSNKDYSRNINESFDKKQTLSIMDIDKKGNGLKAIVGNGEDD